MSVSQGIKSIVGFLTQGFEQKEDDIFEDMQNDFEYQKIILKSGIQEIV